MRRHLLADGGGVKHSSGSTALSTISAGRKWCSKGLLNDAPLAILRERGAQPAFIALPVKTFAFYHTAAASTSISTLNAGRVKPETIISVEAGGGVATCASRDSI